MVILPHLAPSVGVVREDDSSVIAVQKLQMLATSIDLQSRADVIAKNKQLNARDELCRNDEARSIRIDGTLLLQ